MNSLLTLSLAANMVAFICVGTFIEEKDYESAIIFGAINAGMFIRNLFYVKDL